MAGLKGMSIGNNLELFLIIIGVDGVVEALRIAWKKQCPCDMSL